MYRNLCSRVYRLEIAFDVRILKDAFKCMLFIVVDFLSYEHTNMCRGDEE